MMAANSDSVATLLQSLPDSERCSEPKRLNTEVSPKIKSPYNYVKMLKIQVTLGLKDFQSLLEQTDVSYRNHCTSLCVLPKPKQDKSLGNYIMKALEEIKQLEDICRKKRHSILALKERMMYLSRAQQQMMAARELYGRSYNQHDDIDSSNYNDRGKHDDFHKTSTSEFKGIPDLCPIESFCNTTSYGNTGNVQNKDYSYQTKRYPDQEQESITWFPEYAEMSSIATTTETHDKDFPSCNEILINDNSCTHVSVIKSM